MVSVTVRILISRGRKTAHVFNRNFECIEKKKTVRNSGRIDC